MFDKFLSRPLYKEFIQDDVTVENLYQAYLDTDRDEFLKDAKSLRGYLAYGSSENVAKIIEGKK
jgi:lipid-A-disaccharide synthase